MEQSKYQPLYLKHRPQALGELVGQSSVVKTLTNAIENKRIAHAYLFTGPRGTGKTSSARILAKSLNCEHGPTVTPCLTCVSCVEVKDSSSPSVFEIDAASNNSVDDARLIIERAPLVAQGGKFKLYIVDECHMLTKEAFNALLKTIEEPPPGVIFILATTEEHKVPPTILSRCQRLMFRLVNMEELSAHLKEVAKKENIEIEQEALDLITRRSGGGLRDALGLLDQASLLARPGEPVSQKDLLILLGALDEDVLLTISKGIMERNGKEVLDAITGLVMQGREPALIAQELAKHFLNLTKASYVNQGGGSSETGRFVLGSSQYLAGLIEQAKSFERVELTQMVETLDQLEQSLKRSTQPSMSLEIALLSLCHRHDIASVKQLESRINQLEEMIAEGGATLGTRQPTPPARPVLAAHPQAPEVLPHHRQPSGAEVLPHHKQAPAAPNNEVLPHRQQPAAQSIEVLPHHRQPAEQPPVQSSATQPAPPQLPQQTSAPEQQPQHPAHSPVPPPSQDSPVNQSEPAVQNVTPASVEPQPASIQSSSASLQSQTPALQNTSTASLETHSISVQSSDSPSSSAQSTLPSGLELQATPDQQMGSATQSNETSSESFESGDSEDDDDSSDVVVSSVQTFPALPPAPTRIYGDDADEEEYEDSSSSHSPDDADYQQDPASAMPAEAAYSQPLQPVSPVPMSMETGYSQPAHQPPADPLSAAHAQPMAVESVRTEAAPAATPGGDGELPHAQLEKLWSDLLDALHKRSIPAYSLVSMHAFPLRFEAKTLTLGVNKEFFQKSIENKTNNIVVAYKDLYNEEIRVLVKVIADAPSPRGDAPAKKSSSSGDTGMETSPAMPQPRAPEVAHQAQSEAAAGRINQEPRGQEMAEPSRVPPATATIPRPNENQNREREAAAPQSVERNRPIPHTPPPEPGHGAVTTSVTSNLADSLDSSKLKEAYKIFEGPGSRLIG